MISIKEKRGKKENTASSISPDTFWMLSARNKQAAGLGETQDSRSDGGGSL